MLSWESWKTNNFFKISLNIQHHLFLVNIGFATVMSKFFFFVSFTIASVLHTTHFSFLLMICLRNWSFSWRFRSKSKKWHRVLFMSTWKTYISSFEKNDSHSKLSWTVEFNKFKLNRISHIVIRRFASTNDLLVSSSASTILPKCGAPSTSKYPEQNLPSSTTVVLLIHFSHEWISLGFEHHFYQFCSKTVKYLEKLLI